MVPVLEQDIGDDCPKMSGEPISRAPRQPEAVRKVESEQIRIGHSGLIQEFSDTVRGEVSLEGSPAAPEMGVRIPDEWIAHHVLERRFRDADQYLPSLLADPRDLPDTPEDSV